MPQLAIRRDTPHQDGLNNSDQTVSKCRAHGTSELAVLTSPSRVCARFGPRGRASAGVTARHLLARNAPGEASQHVKETQDGLNVGRLR
jgi:hypothetical protein